MTLAVIASRALDGLDAPAVRVEVHLANGLPSFTLVGLADTEVKEARERVRAALAHSGLGFPHNKRITVNLAPADLPKESGRFDLPIALGILAANEQIDAGRLERHEFAGELSLAGELRPIRGALALAFAVRRAGSGRSLVLPAESAAQAALVDDVVVCGARHLLDVVAALQPGDGAEPLPRTAPPVLLASADGPDLRDVRGQAAVKRVLEIAAAGGHSLLMVGAPGTGKSMLAQRLPGLLPPMGEDEALASAAIASLASKGFDLAQWRVRPVRAPHHSASAAALVGGGSPPRPGEISLAHGGVLFLDELPEFPRSALEALREPLETGRVTLSRAARQATYPARFQLVAAMNPCPCGYLGSPPAAGRSCRCTPDMVLRYQGRLSGPLLDRIDLQVDVPNVPPAELMQAPPGESSRDVAARVAAARARQQARQGRVNAELEAADVPLHCVPDAAAGTLLQRAAERLGWSGRGLHRTLRVARTLADMEGAAAIGVPHVAEALQYRTTPLVR
ncbi:YifB family Mg chelatase-like AAA ATPase [Aquincola sp. MAHUQ-54]|uniref:YifB family Mg chelatase-like AAA ATPase n=1 Tax=Aquincola agrisoli TaxID=3119538 RepID=A0AAW9QNZ3_9BURK